MLGGVSHESDCVRRRRLGECSLEEAFGAVAGREGKGVWGMWIRGSREEGGAADEGWGGRECVLGGEVAKTVGDVHDGSTNGIGEAGTS